MKVTGRNHEPVAPPQINIEGNPANPIGWVLISYISKSIGETVMMPGYVAMLTESGL